MCSRDFFKFISRVCSIADGSKDSALDLYLNALDCFVCSQTPSSTRDDVAIHLGGLFNFSREAAIKIWQSRRPELHLNRALTRVEAGRAVIPIRKSINWELQLTKFAFHTPFIQTFSLIIEFIFKYLHFTLVTTTLLLLVFKGNFRRSEMKISISIE